MNMKRQLLLILSLVLIASEGIAQDTIFPWDCPRYLTIGRPPIEGRWGNNMFGHSSNGALPGPQIIGHSFYAPGATVYGLAVSIEHTGWACYTDNDQRHHVAYLGSLAKASRTDSLQVWMMLMEKSGDTIRRLDSVHWHYRSRPDIVWVLPRGYDSIYPYAYEFYFDHPIQMSDTFWACIRAGEYSNDDYCTGLFSSDLSCYALIWPSTSMEGEGTSYYINWAGENGEGAFFFYPNRIYFAFTPILAPPDTDHVGCRAPRLRFMRASSGRPYFEWTAYTDEETLQYEVQYAQLGSNEWRTTYPTSSPFRRLSTISTPPNTTRHASVCNTGTAAQYTTPSIGARGATQSSSTLARRPPTPRHPSPPWRAAPTASSPSAPTPPVAR